ncbi:MAG: flavin reductase, partial [Oscillospiraceae bacterium]|nr:flavin reductase [Oscillospiraceae bacterium]
MLAESPLSLECKVVRELPLGTHNMLLAEIVAVNVDEKLLAADGKLRLDKADLLAFAHGEYYELGQRLGSFGYSVKKPVKKSRGKAKPKSAPDKRRNSK